MFLNTAVWIKVMLAILIAFVVSFALTPVVKILAQKVGAMDVPGEARRVHDHPIPRMGGLAIFIGCVAPVWSTALTSALNGAAVLITEGITQLMYIGLPGLKPACDCCVSPSAEVTATVAVK